MLISKYYSYILPNAITVPNVLKHTVKTILARDNKVNLMIVKYIESKTSNT